MNKLSTAKRVQIVAALVEGNSLRATSRRAGCSINTVTKLLVDLGSACYEYQYEQLRNLPCKRLQCDENWSFCYSQASNVPAEKQGEFGGGDVWTWTAICADTKLIPSWFVGDRSAGSAQALMLDLAKRLPSERVQLTTDGLKVYIDAVDDPSGGRADYAMLQKVYGRDQSEPKTRYSPDRYIGTMGAPMRGNPDPEHVSTSYIERQNLTMRMSMRRFTRLPNRFSTKIENHMHAIALHFLHYNFAQMHKTLRVTPAMEAGVSDHLWSLEEVLGLLDSN